MDLETQLQASLGNHYRLERELGGGGMARVFLATDTGLGRKVVIKVLPPDMSSVVLSERFRREISLAAQLRHPHIVPLFTAAEASGVLYYTMPYVEGESLRDRLRREALPISDVLRLVREIAYALSYAHEHGVVHRDIKPENILIENGHALVADFGVAKAITSSADKEQSATGPMTSPGVAMGTATYMAPEQASADPSIDHRADLYALGVVAYEMLSGAPPFSGNQHQVIVAHMTQSPTPVDSVRPDVPEAVCDLVMRLLEKKPEDRPQSASEVVSSLDALGASAPTATVSSRRSSRRSRRAPAGAMAVIVIATIVYGAFQLAGGGSTTPEVAPKSVAVLPFVNTSGDKENEHFSNGLTDELISALGQVKDLKVAARTSVFALNNRGLGARAIAETLGVATVIEGSARRDGQRLKVTAQLVSAADGGVLWSEAFDRRLVDVFTVQEEISRSIVNALSIHLSANARTRMAARATTDIATYDLYLRGRNHWSKRTKKDMELAVEYFQQALQRDPRFAPAYADMASTYVAMSNLNFLPANEGLTRARVSADHAISLDSTLGEAHAARGFVLASSQEFAESERELRRAIELSPSSSQAHHYYTLLLTMMNRGAEAIEHNRITLSLDPLLVPANAHRPILLCQTGKCAEAKRDFERRLPLTRTVPFSHHFFGALEAREGRFDNATRHLTEAQRIAPGYIGVAGALAYTYARLGRKSESDSIRAALRAAAVDDRSRIQHALAEAAMGDLDRAFTVLQMPTRWDVPALIELRADPLLAGFRSDPRYAALLARIGLRP